MATFSTKTNSNGADHVCNYPKRPSHFACKAVRAMLKSCAAYDVGVEGIALLTFIAHTEDASHYRRPVAFRNEQLAAICGLSVTTLKRVRKKCVDHGWLTYIPGARGRTPRYYVTIPDYAADLGDHPSDDDEAAGIEGLSDTQSGLNLDPIRTQSEIETEMSASQTLNPDSIRPQSGLNCHSNGDWVSHRHSIRTQSGLNPAPIRTYPYPCTERLREGGSPSAVADPPPPGPREPVLFDPGPDPDPEPDPPPEPDATPDEHPPEPLVASNAASKPAEPAEAREVVAAWNELGAPFPACLKLSDRRRRALRSRLADPHWREHWRSALARLPSSPFLRGENDRGWRANIDWFLRPDSVVNILEGKYDDGPRRPSGGSTGAGSAYEATVAGLERFIARGGERDAS